MVTSIEEDYEKIKSFKVDPSAGFPKFSSVYQGSAIQQEFEQEYETHRKKINKQERIAFYSVYLASIIVVVGVAFVVNVEWFSAIFVGTIFMVAAISFVKTFFSDKKEPIKIFEAITINTAHVSTFRNWVAARYGLDLNYADAEKLLRSGEVFPTAKQGYRLVDVQGMKHVVKFDGSELRPIVSSR